MRLLPPFFAVFTGFLTATGLKRSLDELDFDRTLDEGLFEFGEELFKDTERLCTGDLIGGGGCCGDIFNAVETLGAAEALGAGIAGDIPDKEADATIGAFALYALARFSSGLRAGLLVLVNLLEAVNTIGDSDIAADDFGAATGIVAKAPYDAGEPGTGAGGTGAGGTGAGEILGTAKARWLFLSVELPLFERTLNKLFKNSTSYFLLAIFRTVALLSLRV